MKQLASKPRLSPASIGFIASDSANIVQRCELVLFPPKSFSKLARAILGTIVLAFVVLSYVFVVQPITPPPVDAGVDYISITQQNSYLVSKKDDTYDLLFDGKFLCVVSSSEMKSLPYSSLPIKDEEDSK